MNEFLLVQWLAPLASESPEGMIALLFALKGKGSVGLGALISSKVNQWTLLVGALPLAYGLAAGGLAIGGLAPMVLDARQKEELLLTSAQSLFAVVVISDFRFALWEAMMLLILFTAQLLMPQENIRYIFCGLYLAAAVILLIMSRTRRQMLWDALLFKSRRPQA
jgi:cation:H+ antiporter